MLLKNLVLAEDGLQYPHLIPATPPPLSQWEKYDLGLDVLVRLTPLLKQGSTPRRGEGGRRDSHMKGCSSETLNYTPKGDQCGRGPTFFGPQKETILNFDYMNRGNKTN